MPHHQIIRLRHHRRAARGFNLVQLALVLGIIGLILGALWVAASSVMTSNKVRQSVSELQSIASAVRGIYEEQGSMTDSGTATLVPALDQLKAFPLIMRQNQATAAGILYHPWSLTAVNGLGSVGVDADDCSGAKNTSGAAEPCFEVTFYGVPQNACVMLATAGSQAGVGLQQLNINTTNSGSVTSATTPLPVPATTANSNCNNGNSSGANDLTWIYSIRSNGS